ncbi:sigma-70 family RNA polymerase sigma factor [Ferruginibacter paludis]|uniref:RNA polymerase sigma factor n=1 Tax=Ferruginibacter paludis TaxID=1310417 RepID=UPI0025B624A5|nr:sigma-70 family RNA polymerase sigma factor [Ferruginibacter paludis]MDN3655025.1 sigma-70 family RNA polymerase sigma factor [Ferruginibacter paludis]
MELNRTFDDATLVQALRSDSNPDDAIRHLYRTQYNLTKVYIQQNSGSEEDAEDIFQEVICTFIDIVKKDKFRGESSVSTFLYALTRNTWLNELKKRDRAKIRDEKFEKQKDTTGPDVGHFIANRETKNQLMQLVDSLGATCKQILLAFYFDNLAMKDILKTLAYENEQVVRNKKYKCLKQLEQMITSNPQLAKNLKSVYE